HALFAGVADDLVVRGHERLRQELRHVLDDGPGFLLVQGGEGRRRELGGDFAFRVAAHAVGQQEQARLPRVAIAHAVFVLFAAALAADLVDAETHRNAPRLGGAESLHWIACRLRNFPEATRHTTHAGAHLFT